MRDSISAVYKGVYDALPSTVAESTFVSLPVRQLLKESRLHAMSVVVLKISKLSTLSKIPRHFSTSQASCKAPYIVVNKICCSISVVLQMKRII